MKAKKILKKLKKENKKALNIFEEEYNSKRVGDNLKYILFGKITNINQTLGFIERLENN